MIPFIDLKEQRRQIADEIDAAITKVLEHGQFIMGPEVKSFEENLSDFAGTKHAVSCANGTDALVLALRALEIGQGHAVFAPSFTFVATVECCRLVGATPVFVDVCPDTFNICPKSLADSIDAVKRNKKLTPKAIIPVDLFGQPADYDTIEQLANAEGLFVISDAAQSFGASLNEKRVGQFGALTTTSFFPAKPLGCYGDGGAILTDDDELALLLRSYRNHGQGVDRYDNVNVGLNSRLDTIQAAILIEKLKIFPSEIESRCKVAEFYSQGLQKTLQQQTVMFGAKSVWAQYTLVSENRDAIRAALNEEGIPTAVYYPKPNHLQAPYIDAPRAPKGLPVTEHLQARVFSLPMHPYLDEDTQEKILSTLRSV